MLDSSIGFFVKYFRGFITSWRIYLRHDVRNAGIGLACLYMTVLGFDSITTSYAYSQGVPESILGVLQAAGAGIGLLGSVVFPSLVRYLGVERTGNPFANNKSILPVPECYVFFSILGLIRSLWIRYGNSLPHSVRWFRLGSRNPIRSCLNIYIRHSRPIHLSKCNGL